MNTHWSKGVLVVFIVGLLVASFSAVSFSQDKPYEGVTITVFTQNPPFIAKPVKMFAPDWEAKTGGNVRLVTSPWAELYEKMYSSFALGAKRFDIILFPAAWLASFAQNQFLQPLDEYIEGDEDLKWEGILSTYRDLTKWNDKTYAVPLDADNHIFYYRTDALENPEYQERFKGEYGYEMPVPPKTWEQHEDIAEFFNGWDWDDDGNKEYGVVEAMRKGDQAYWTYFSKAASYCSLPGQPGGLFFDPNNMEPLINNPCHVKALEQWIETKEFGVPGMLNMDSGEIRSVFTTAGDAAMSIDWGDIGVMGSTSEESVVKGKVGYSIMPGTTEVWDYEKKEWVDCTENPDRCGGSEVNRAPYLAFGGWFGAIDKNSPNVKAAYDFLSYMANPENSYTAITTPETGFNPSRELHFERLSGWIGYGFENPKPYLDAIKNTIGHTNVQPDLRIPEANRYFEAFDAQLSMALAGQKTPQDALDAVAQEWNKITENIGKESQLAAYRASLGLPPKE